ncbi:MAG TPA: hypothetical protein VMT03_01820 [Polyangia bacterium]|nr:hypothetical protein [Polyangia bacterium]
MGLRPWILQSRVAICTAAALCALSFATFLWSPNHQLTDSGYALLVSENLIRHGDLDLARYRLDSGPGSNYRLEHAGDHVHYYFPVAGSILSVPYVAVDRLIGRAIADGDHYDSRVERAVQARLAALLMAAFTAIVFFTARLMLPNGASAAVALVVAFGTQVYSTASRTLWSDDWALVLVGLSVYLLLRAAARDAGRPLVWLATLESWAYFVRPTNGIVLAGTAILLLLVERRASWKFFVTAGLWVAAFVGWSLAQTGEVLPSYFRNRLGGATGESLVGTLLSPSRGLFVCVPATLAVALLLVRTWSRLPFRPLVRLAIGICVAQWLVVAGFDKWWGGHCFGARLFTGLVPWLALLGVLGLVAARPISRALTGLLIGLAALSVLINAAGAISAETFRWNLQPENVDLATGRLWSWSRSQPLAPLRD